MSYFSTLKTLIEEKIIEDTQFNAETAFCEIVSEYLVDTSLISDIQHSPYYEKKESGRSLKINGFCINENETVLSLFIADYNNTNDEVANTSAIGTENRDAGDCDSDDQCVWMVISGSTVRGKLPGEWTADIQNEKTHNTEIKHFIIELQYR